MYLSKSESTQLMKFIDEMSIGEDEIVVIMLAENHHVDIPLLISKMNRRNIPFIGAIFPGLIYGTDKYDEGALVSLLPCVDKPFLIQGLNDEVCMAAHLEKMALAEEGYTALVIVDGLSSGIGTFLTGLYNRLGHSVNYFGGGAGSLTLEQSPCVFNSEGFFQDAAIVSFVKLESKLGVRHGWEKIAGPIVATNTKCNTIKELNWQNAFNVYQEVVEKDAGERLTMENFFDIAKGYPFGIIKEGMEDVVRDPISTNEKGALICVGEVPENTVLSILKGQKKNLIHAAGQATDDCLTMEARAISHCLIVDCISRTIFLEEDFSKELKTVNDKIHSVDPNMTPYGVLTLGEISSYGDGFLEFFNKTIVICVGFTKK